MYFLPVFLTFNAFVVSTSVCVYGPQLSDSNKWMGYSFCGLDNLCADETAGRKRFVTGSQDETLLTWTWKRADDELNCVTACRGHSRSVDCVSVSPNGSQVFLVTAS